MPMRSLLPELRDIPKCNVLTYLFGPPTHHKGDAAELPLWADALDDEHSLTKLDALLWIKRLALGLERHCNKHPGHEDGKGEGRGRGTVVMMISPNHVYVPIAYLAVLGGGLIFSGANPMSSVDDLAHQMRDTDAQLVLAHPALLPKVRAAADKAGISHDSLYAFAQEDAQSECKDWRALLASSDDAARWTWPTLNGDEVATVNYSSGTTGLPKGVMVSHANLVANCAQSIAMKYVTVTTGPGDKMEYAMDLPTTTTMDANVRVQNEDERDRWVGFLPLFHAFGQMNAILMACRLAVPVYILQAFDFEVLLRVLEQRRITAIQVAPPIMVLLRSHPGSRRHDLSSLRQITCGAAPLSKSVQNDVQRDILSHKDARIGQGWGMTEVSCTGIVVPSGVHDDSGSVGMLVPNTEAKLLDEHGEDVTLTPGRRGELYYRGPNTSPGYWRNAKATAETMLDGGWLRTGDVATVDEHGWFSIVDRIKELIKVSGFQVAPAEMEALLLRHPSVADVAVTGVSASFHEQERVRAYVALQPGQNVSEKEIVDWTATQVPKYKHLTGGVVFVDAVPKSPSGKILRRVLRDWARRDGDRGDKAKL